MGKYCTSCGVPLEDSALFCGGCGARQNRAEKPADMVHKIDGVKTACEEARIGGVSAPPYRSGRRENRGIKPFIFAISGIAVICIATLFAVFLLNRDNNVSDYIPGEMDEIEQRTTTQEANDKLPEEVEFILNREVYAFKDTPYLYSTVINDMETHVSYTQNWSFREILNDNNFKNIKWTTQTINSDDKTVFFTGNSVIGSYDCSVQFYVQNGAEIPIALEMKINKGEVSTELSPLKFVEQGNSEEFESALIANDASICIMLVLLADISEEALPEDNQTSLSTDYQSNSSQKSAQLMFESFLNGKDEIVFNDENCDECIIICKVEPDEYNNYATYAIGGRGFSFYDTDCIEADESIQRWIFESNGYYYMIVEGLDGYYIYYDTSRERLSESSECWCGFFSTYAVAGSNAGENDITVKNFEQKVSLRKGNSGITDYAMEAYKQEIDESGSPYTFTYKYIGECSDGFYYYNGEDLTFNVYRITYKDGGQSIYFMPLNVEENMVWELYENYYELIYRWTQY